jgi:predicted Zn-dependent protease
MKAENAIASQKFTEAKSLLLILTAQPNSDATTTARAFYDLGFTNEALHDEAAAEAAYRAAIAADPQQFESHAALGLLLRDPAESRKELLAAASLTPAANENAARAEVARALAHIDVSTNPEAAREEILAAIKLTGETPEDLLLTARIVEKMDSLTDAEATYRRALTARPNDPDAAFAFAGMLMREDKLPTAESVLTSALKAHPGDAPLTAQLARLYMLQGASEKALPLLNDLHTLHPQEAATTRMLADVCVHTGDAPRADELYQALLTTSPNDISLLAARGDALIRQKRFAEAQSILQRANALFLAHPSALPGTDEREHLTGLLAFAASENGQPTAVLTALDQRAQYADETPATLFLRATAHDHLHHVAQARSYYTQFIAAAKGKLPNEEWEAKHRLIALAHEK